MDVCITLTLDTSGREYISECRKVWIYNYKWVSEKWESVQWFQVNPLSQSSLYKRAAYAVSIKITPESGFLTQSSL
jgi:hypothetical protein